MSALFDYLFTRTRDTSLSPPKNINVVLVHPDSHAVQVEMPSSGVIIQGRVQQLLGVDEKWCVYRENCTENIIGWYDASAVEPNPLASQIIKSEMYGPVAFMRRGGNVYASLDPTMIQDVMQKAKPIPLREETKVVLPNKLEELSDMDNSSSDIVPDTFRVKKNGVKREKREPKREVDEPKRVRRSSRLSNKRK